MPAGRPPKYGDEMLSKANQYLTDYDVIPSIAGLAVYLGTCRETIYDWSRKFPEFSDIVTLLLSKQEQVLIQKGLTGDFNPSITKVILTKHGYSEKQDLTLAGPNGGPVEFSKIERVIVDAKDVKD
jgi:hypothetical protein